MRLILISIFLITISVSSVKLIEAEKAISDYNQLKQSMQLVFAKSDKAIGELVRVVTELQKEAETNKKSSE